MQSPDHPELVYLEALTTGGDPMYTTGRPDGKPLWVVIHDMEKTEDAGCAEWTANYFHTGAGGRSVSSHYCADNDSIVQCVLLRHSAWTVGNRPGNNRGINWEMCGYAAQTRAQWLDPFGLAMFNRMAPIIRSDAAKYGIPLVKRTVAELRAWTPGVTSHNDLRLAFDVTDHTDPGSGFPWDMFMQIINGDDGGDDMAAAVVNCKENGGFYSYPVPKWFRSVAAAEAAAAAYGVPITSVATLADVRARFGYIPGDAAAVASGQADVLADVHGNVLPATGGGGGGGGGPVDLTPAAVAAVADATADEIAADPERDGRDT
jgi:hypothetical protein